LLLLPSNQRYGRVKYRRRSFAIDLARVRGIGQHLGELAIEGVLLFLIVLFLFDVLDEDHILVIVIIVDPGFMDVLRSPAMRLSSFWSLASSTYFCTVNILILFLVIISPMLSF
jgi:hypothetical protein